MTDKAVLKYYEKRRLVFQRQNERMLAESRVLILEKRFKAINPFLERDQWIATQQQLGEAYKILMRLRKVKIT